MDFVAMRVMTPTDKEKYEIALMNARNKAGGHGTGSIHT